MRSLLCKGEGQVVIVEVSDPVPGPGEALIRIDASAVCGSEREDLLRGADGNTGHEACGTVVDPGPSSFQPGDRVGLAAVAGCGECDRCLVGRELHCRRGPRSSSGSGGWHAEYATVAVSALRALPEGIDAGVGVLLTGDPLGVPSRSLRRVPVEPGDQVAVIGLGPVGLAHVAVRAFAGAEVIGIEPSAYRRELALGLGAHKVAAPGEALDIKPRVVIESTGLPACIKQALDLVDSGGVVLQSGECHLEVPINPSDSLIRREITYTGSWYYATEDYPFMRELYERGIPLERLCTHDVVAADAQHVITEFLEGRTGKVVLRWR